MANIHNGLEVNSWKATSTAAQRIDIDTFSADTSADSLLIGAGHNLVGATISLWKSTTGAWAGEQVAVVSGFVAAAGLILKEFTQTTSRYWALYVNGTIIVIPEIQIAMLCNKTELDYASTSFDPHAQDVVSDINISAGGFVSGIFTRYTERSMQLSFIDVSTPDGWDADATNVYYKLSAWYEGNGMKQFVVAWENANRPTDVFLMRWDGKRNNAMSKGGAFRDIDIKLKGRKV